MKHVYSLALCLLFLISCSKDESDPNGPGPNPGAELTACFTISKETIAIGENLQLSNCSEGASSYSYDFGNGVTSSAEDPVISYDEAGAFTITLTAMNDDDMKTTNREVVVTGEEANFIFPEVPNGFISLPLEAGIGPGGELYVVELLEDLVGTGGSKFYYQELDTNFEATAHYIADKPFNSGSAFANFYPSGNQNFVFSRTLDALYGTQEVTYNSSWGFINTINSAAKHSYGFIPEGANFLYFGTEDDAGVYKTAIETRNASGDAFQVSLNALGTADSMLGDLIKTVDGYIGFGAVFTKNATTPHISNYKPLLVFFDTSFNVVSHVIYNDSVLDTKLSSSNDLNGSYHLEQLSNGNLVLYANGELLVTDENGVQLNIAYFDGTSSIQALTSLGDSFIISTAAYLRKMDASGVEIKKVQYDGHYLPELIDFNGDLFFAAGYDTTDTVEGLGELSTIKLFYGAVDSALNFVALE